MDESFTVRDLRNQDWIWTAKALLFHADCDEKMYKTYCGLAAYADNVTQEAYPSIELLRKKLHMGRNTLLRAIAKLEAFSFVSTERKQGCPNIYTLLAIPEKSPPRGKGRSGKKPDEPEPEPEKFDWDKYLVNMATNKRRAVKILAFYFQRKQLVFSNKEQVQIAIDEQIGFAEKLKAFEKPKIVWAMDKLDRDFPAWTLKTIIKELVK